MAMNKWDILYFEFCESISKLSSSKRLKVGAVIVKDNNMISYGYNGTPSGFENNCESPFNVTLPEVIHAEINAIAKAAKQGISTDNSVLYCNICPCSECAKLIIQAGIKTVFFKQHYRDNKGYLLLKKANIQIHKYIKE